MRRLSVIVISVILLSSVVSAQDAEPVTTREAAPDASAVTLTLVANGFFRPVLLTNAGDDTGRLFILEQNGRIWIYLDGQILPEAFLDLTDRVSQSVTRGYSELGLLGLAFPPDFAETGVFYVHYNDRNNRTILSQFNLSDDPNIGDPASEVVLLTLDQPFPNHNGGEIAFGPNDGYLYFGLGDGGSAGDPLDTGQDPSDWYGSILRIAVTGDGTYSVPEDNPSSSREGFAPEVWSYGLRNPYRFSFDSATGDMYIADVGQNIWEEINFQPAESTGGENYGWSDYEASVAYNANAVPADMTYPVAEYRHEAGRCSVTGGYVYRGEAISELQGVYLYGDYCSGETWAAWRNLDGEWQNDLFVAVGENVTAFGRDQAGELYIVTYNGDIYRIDPVQ
jgi:glucose/arabinose dehydrogenase